MNGTRRAKRPPRRTASASPTLLRPPQRSTNEALARIRQERGDELAGHLAELLGLLRELAPARPRRSRAA